MKKTNRWLLYAAVIILTGWILSAPAFAGDRFSTEYGRDASGRQTETQHGGAWGDTVITFDPATGLEIYRKWIGPSGQLWSETFTNLQTGEVRKISYFDAVTEKPNRTEETEINPRVLDRVEQIKLSRQRAQELAQKKDWDFLPGFQPGMVRDAEIGRPASNQNTGSSESMPLEPPQAFSEDTRSNESVEPQPSSAGEQFEGYREEAPAEIDYSQYGDTEVLDSSGRFAMLNKKTGTIADFQEFDGQTYATVRLNGKVVQTDIYDGQGKLISSKVLNPMTQKWEDRTEIKPPEQRMSVPKKISSAFDRSDALKNPMNSMFQGAQTPTAAIDAPAFASRDMGNEAGIFSKSAPAEDHHYED